MIPLGGELIEVAPSLVDEEKTTPVTALLPSFISSALELRFGDLRDDGGEPFRCRLPELRRTSSRAWGSLCNWTLMTRPAGTESGEVGPLRGY